MFLIISVTSAFFIALPASAADLTWNGGGGDNNWSTGANWGGTAPVSNDRLLFGGSTRLSNTNDLSGLTVGNGTANAIAFNAGSGAFVIGGNDITLNGNIANSGTSLQTINLNMATTAVRTVTLTTGGGNITLGGVISGAGGGLTLSGTGSLTLSGANSYNGNTTFAANQLLNINNNSALGTGILVANGNGQIDNTSGSAVTIENNFNLSNGSPTFVGSNALTINGTTTVSGASRTLTVSAGTLTLKTINADTTARNFTKAGAGTLAITEAAGANLQGEFRLSAGTLVLGNKSAMGSGLANITATSILQASTDLDGANAVANTVTVGSDFTVSGSRNLTLSGNVTQTNARTITSSLDAGKIFEISGNLFLSSTSGNGRTLTLAGSGDTLFSGNIANFNGGAGTAGSVTITNTGTTRFAGTNTYTGTTRVDAGVLLLASAGALPGGIGSAGGTSYLNLQGGILGLGTGDFSRGLGTGSTQVNIASGGFAAYGANRSVNLGGSSVGVTWGAGNFMAGAGDVVFSLGATGADATLDFQNPIALGNSTRTVNVANGSASIDAILSGVLSGSGASGGLTKNGTGTLALTAANTYSGATTINAGTLQIGNGGTTGSLNATSTITNDGALAFNRTDTLTQGTHFSTAAISGSGSLVQNGSGTVVLNAANTYTGGTALNAGTIRIDATNALGTSGNISFGGGTLQYGSGISTDLSARLKNSASAIAINTNNQSVTFASAIDSTNAGGLTKSGAGTLTLSGTNTFTGATTVNTGTLAVNGSIATSSLTTINSGAVLVGSGTLGALTIASGGTINPGNSPGTLSVGDTTWAGGGNYNWQIYDATGSAGTGWDLISSTGTLTIGATSGDKFKINLQTLSSLSPDTPGAPQNFSAASNYSWGIASFSSISGFSDDKFQIDSTGFSGFTGTFSISSNGTVLTLNYTAPSASAVWTAGSGNWSAGANWQSGSVPSEGSPLEFSGAGGTSSNNGALSSVAGITFTASAGGSYTINGSALQTGALGILNNSSHSQTVATDLTLTAPQSFNAAAANLSITGAVDNNGQLLIATGAQTLTISGAVSGSGGLAKSDSGTTILTAVNTYSGATTINAGTLQIGNGGTTGSLNATSTITNDGALAFNRTDTLTQGTHFSTAAISGSGSLVQNGSGTVVLNAANTYTGGTTLNAGAITLNHANALGTTGNITFGGGSLEYGSGISTDLSSRIKNSSALIGIDTNGETVTYASNIDSTNSGGLFKTGSGTLVLTANNTYSGTTTIDEGTLQLGNGGTSGAVSGPIAVTGNLLVNRSNDHTISAIISGSGTLTKNGSGTLTLTGANTFDGTTTVNAGVLTLNRAGGPALSGDIIVSGGRLNFSNATQTASGKSITLTSGSLAVANTQTFGSLSVSGGNMTRQGGVLTINGAANFSGGGAVSFSAANSEIRTGTSTALGNVDFQYTSTSTTPTGAFLLGSDLSVDEGASAIFTNTSSGIGRIDLGTASRTFTVGTGATLSSDWVVAGASRALTKAGEGSLILGANNTYSGGTELNGGTITIGRSNALGTSGNVSFGGGALRYGSGISTDLSARIKNSTAAIAIDTNGELVSFASAIDSTNIGGLTKSGNGTLTLNASNTYSGETTVNAGTLRANHASALGTNATITVTGGSLLVGMNDAINDKTIFLNKTISGNASAAQAALAFDTAYSNTSGTAGSLTLNQDSIIDLGNGGVVVHFTEIANLNTYILHIFNWEGDSVWSGSPGGGKDQFYVDQSLSAPELNNIRFYSGLTESSFLSTGRQLGPGSGFQNEVIAVPEPETLATALLLALGCSVWIWKQHRIKLTNL